MTDTTRSDRFLLDDVLALPVPAAGDARILELRKFVPRAYAPWTSAEERCLLYLLQTGLQVSDISLLLLRQYGGITARMRRLNLEPQEEIPSKTVTAENFIPRVLGQLFAAEVRGSASASSQGLSSWIQQRRPRAGKGWSATENHCLIALTRRGWTAPQAAAALERGLIEVKRQLRLLKLADSSSLLFD